MKLTYTLISLSLALVASAQEPISLNQAIHFARTQRPAFEAARLRVVQAHHSRRALGAFPATRLFVGYTSDPEVGGTDDDLVLAQPLDLFGRSAAARELGSAEIVRAEAGLRQVAVELQAEVVTAYVGAATSAELARAAKSTFETIEKLFQATRLRVEEGVAPGVQLTRVGIELEQARLRAEQRRAELEANVQRLSALLGGERSRFTVEGIPQIQAGPIDDQTLLRQRPEILVLASDVRLAEAEARIAKLTTSPELELQARRTPWQQSDQRYGLRLQISVPLMDFGKARAESRAASTRAEAARRSLDDAMKLAVGEVAAAKIEADSAELQISKYEALVATAKQLVERLRPALTEQATTLIEVIDALRSLRDVEAALVEARERRALAQARLLRATGQVLEVTP